MFVIKALSLVAVRLEVVEVVAYGIPNAHTPVHVSCIARHCHGQVVLAEYSRRGEVAQLGTVADACQHSTCFGIALYLPVEQGILRTYIYEECAVEVAGLVMFPHQREGQLAEALPELGRDDGGTVGEARQYGSLVQPYPAAADDDYPSALYVNVYRQKAEHNVWRNKI